MLEPANSPAPDEVSWAIDATTRSILEAAVDAVVTIDERGIVRFYNAAAEALLGYSRHEVLGRNVAMLMGEPHASAHDSYISRYCRDGVRRWVGRGRDLDARHRDGHLIPVSQTLCETWDAGERRFTAFLRDLSERRAAQARDAQLAQFTQENPHPVLRIDASGCVTYANAAAERFLEREDGTNERAIGETLAEFCTWSLAEGSTLDLQLESAETTCAFRFCPDRLGGGVNLYGHDVTERLCAENAVRRSEATLSTILESVADGILIVDQAGCVLRANRAAGLLLGRSARDLVEQELPSLLEPHHPAALMAEIIRVSHTDGQARFEATARTGTGNVVPVECSASPVRLADADAFTVVVRDVSERARLEQERRELQERLVETARTAGQCEVATGVLHNVGNTLNSIATGVTVLRDRLSESELPPLCQALDFLDSHWPLDSDSNRPMEDRAAQLREYLRVATGQLRAEHQALAAEVVGLTRHVEHVARTVVAQQSYAKRISYSTTIEPRGLADEAVSVVAAMNRAAGLVIERRYAAVPRVTTDPHSLLQVLVNLLANAVDAVANLPAEERRVELTVEQHEQSVRWIVSDNGEGIRPEHLSRVFAYGFTTKPGGHGFGLHSAALSVAQLGGTIEAASSGPGQGAEFRVAIPVAGDRGE